MGNVPWDGMGRDRQQLLWDGNGTDKYVPWTTLRISNKHQNLQSDSLELAEKRVVRY